jgi:predicted AlkP superfamily pyrophosphatase or phosphodiesterase
MNSLIGYLLDSLEEERLLNEINIVLVSDHGMAELDEKEFLVLQDYIDVNLVDLSKSVFSEVSNIYPKSEENVIFLSSFLMYFNLNQTFSNFLAH